MCSMRMTAAFEAAKDNGVYQQGGDLEKKYQRVLLNGLVGTVGPVAANNMMTYFKMQGEIPTRDQIIQNPMGVPIPKSGAARCLLISRTLKDMDRGIRRTVDDLPDARGLD